MLVVHAAGEQRAIPIDSVIEIVDHAPLRRLPLMPEGVAGVVDLRGHAIVAMALSATAAMAVVVEQEGRLLALMVDSVEGITADAPQ